MMMKKNLQKLLAVVSACLLAQGAYALTINDSGVAGTVEAGNEAPTVASETAWANYLLSLGANTSSSFNANGSGGDENYQTGNNDYNGTLSGGTRVDGGLNDVSGYEYVLAKYDGQNAGYVLFYVPDLAGNTIPLTSETIWMSNPQQQTGYGLSHFTGFGHTNGVPDAGSSLGLLGLAALGISLIRRRIR